MNYLNKYCTHKIRRRIEIKCTNLKLLLPEPNFLNFIEELDKFKEIIEGVDSDDPSSCVGLRFVHTKYELLLNTYQDLLTYLREKSRAVEERTRDPLLKELTETVCEAIIYLDSSLVDFYSRIILSTNHLYCIRSIQLIHDSLDNLKSDIRIVKKNFDNIQKSASRRNIKKSWTNIFSSALKISSLKLEELNKVFPKSSNRLDSRHTAYENSRARANLKAMAQNAVGVFGSSEINIETISENPEQIAFANNMDETIAEESNEIDLEEEAIEKEEKMIPVHNDMEQPIHPEQISHQIETSSEIEKTKNGSRLDDSSQDELVMDNETYIKSIFRKPLRQALAAITIHQPTDPIDFLANYLLQYRQNELRNIERKQAFENLLLERERYSKTVKSECKTR